MKWRGTSHKHNNCLTLSYLISLYTPPKCGYIFTNCEHLLIYYFYNSIVGEKMI